MLRYVLIVFLITGCAVQANFGEGAEQRKTQSQVFEASYDKVYKTVLQTAGNKEWDISLSEKEAGLIQAKTPETGSRWGDEVSISFNEVENGIEVQIRSTLANKPNREYIQEFLNNIDSKL